MFYLLNIQAKFQSLVSSGHNLDHYAKLMTNFYTSNSGPWKLFGFGRCLVFGYGSRIDGFVHLFLYVVSLSSPLTREKACRINKLVLVNPVRRVRQADLCNMTMFEMQEINTRHCNHNKDMEWSVERLFRKDRNSS